MNQYPNPKEPLPRIRGWREDDLSFVRDLWWNGKTATEIVELIEERRQARLAASGTPETHKSRSAVNGVIRRGNFRRSDGLPPRQKPNRRPKFNFVSGGPGSKGGAAQKRPSSTVRRILANRSSAMAAGRARDEATGEEIKISMPGPVWSLPACARPAERVREAS